MWPQTLKSDVANPADDFQEGSYLWMDFWGNKDLLTIGSTIYYTIYGKGINSLDFNDDYNDVFHTFDPETLTGRAKVGIWEGLHGNLVPRPARISIGIQADGITEGSENLRIKFFGSPPPNGYRGGGTFNNQGVTVQVGGKTILLGNISDTSSGSQRIHRLLNTTTNQYLLTGTQSEIDLLTGARQGVPWSSLYGDEEASPYHWVDEGIASISPPEADQNVVRFLNTKSGKHLYSANDYEIDLLKGDFGEQMGLLYEGVAFKVFSADNPVEGMTPMVRFYNPTNDSHIFSSST